ncbi:MAG: response regulator [Magnetococcales bacterium]|nr:response regulator [Magnetococcales bacterium]NGZ06625.1 response regulator [Magnetococcales bacterium]
METHSTILVVDDDLINRQILVSNLEDVDYRVHTANDGAAAWKQLQSHPQTYAAVLLDRIMPHMDGMEVLKRIKAHPVLQGIPVIMQTSMSSEVDTLDGIQAGAFYYLTKPFDRRTLLAIIRAAVDDYHRHNALRAAVQQSQDAMAMLWDGEFRLRTIQEAKALAASLANICPDPDQVVMGLSELLINAVEHGNLGITYAEKSRAMTTFDGWDLLVEERLALPENSHKWVHLYIERPPGEIRFRIVDQGPGFDWRPFETLSPERAFDTHGRGIAMAKMYSFSSLEFQGTGNEVIGTIQLPQAE